MLGKFDKKNHTILQGFDNKDSYLNRCAEWDDEGSSSMFIFSNLNKAPASMHHLCNINRQQITQFGLKGMSWIGCFWATNLRRCVEYDTL